MLRSAFQIPDMDGPIANASFQWEAECFEDSLGAAFDSQVGYPEEEESDVASQPSPCFEHEPPVPMEGMPEGWSIVSNKYDLVRSPGGSIHSRRKAETVEEAAAQEADYDAWLMENGIMTPEDDWSVPTVVPTQQPMPGHDPDFGPDESMQVEMTSGRKRRGPSTVKCHYIGCERPIDQVPLTCPSHQEGQPDLIHPFCSYECMSAWALYEIGDPLADTLVKLIEHRAGRKIVPAPAWIDAVISGIGSMKLTGPIDSKGLRLEEDALAVGGSRIHEAKLLGDDATVNMDEIADAMEDEEVPPAEPITLVQCRACTTEVDSTRAALRVRLRTSAIWAFCSESCVTGTCEAGENLMTLIEWRDLSRKGHAVLLRRPEWGTEQDDVDPDAVGK